MPSRTEWDSRFLRVADEVATWSKDPIYRHGCVAIKNEEIISTGCNGFPRKMDETLMHDRERKRAIVIHAEKNCIFNTRLREDLKGCTFYLTGYRVQDDILIPGGLTPCATCTSAMIQVGVERLVMRSVALSCIDRYGDEPPYYLESSIDTLRDNGIEVSLVY